MIKIVDIATPEILVSLNKSVHDWHVRNFPDIFKDNADTELYEYFKTSLDRKDCFHFVAYDDSKPIGYIQAEINDKSGSPFSFGRRQVYVNIVVVIEKYRGKGIGKKLFEKVFDVAKSLKIERVELDHWAGNEAAIIFEKLGFKPYRYYMAQKIKIT